MFLCFLKCSCVFWNVIAFYEMLSERLCTQFIHSEWQPLLLSHHAILMSLPSLLCGGNDAPPVKLTPLNLEEYFYNISEKAKQREFSNFRSDNKMLQFYKKGFRVQGCQPPWINLTSDAICTSNLWLRGYYLHSPRACLHLNLHEFPSAK